MRAALTGIDVVVQPDPGDGRPRCMDFMTQRGPAPAARRTAPGPLVPPEPVDGFTSLLRRNVRKERPRLNPAQQAKDHGALG
jgi:hypothetical protein